MRIKTWETVDVEVEVEITIDMIRRVLSESADKPGEIMSLINRVCRLMKAIPDEWIGELPKTHREIASDFLLEQGARFQNPTTKGDSK